MKSGMWGGTSLGAAILLALAFRLPALDLRPMHGDEAVHAIKFGTLLEHSRYAYDPTEYHGPTLNYFTLIPAWLRSQSTLQDVDEWTLRLVPVAFSLLLMLILRLMAPALGWPAVLAAAFLTALSPAMVFYSRYYIQEMLLVTFLAAAVATGERYFRTGRPGWMLLCGASLGLMYATKETAVLFFVVMLFSAVAAWFPYGQPDRPAGAKQVLHITAGLLVGAFIAALFLSSFFKNPPGILDSFRAYRTYMTRAGENPVHLHPWYYYLKILLFAKLGSKPVWTEAFTFFFALLGLLALWRKRLPGGADTCFVRFLSVYTVCTGLVFSAIPYKTPWNALGFLFGVILLAGVGFAAAWRKARRPAARWLLLLLFGAGLGHLGWQSYLGSFKYYADPANPHVYGHTGPDAPVIARRVLDFVAVQPESFGTYVQVICPGDDYWPLPWYLRRLTRVGWWNHVDTTAAAAPVILVAPEVEPDLIHLLYEIPPPGERYLYVPLFERRRELRLNVELRGYVRKDYWDREATATASEALPPDTAR